MANTAINHDPVATFPGSSTNTAVVKWSGTSGNALLDSGVLVDASNNITGLNNVTATGYLHLTGDEKELRFYEGANYIAIKTNASLAANYTFTLPLNDGSADEFLQTNGSGVLTWAAAAGTTINSNADNRVITGSGTANTLEAEANLTYTGNYLYLKGDADDTTSSGIHWGTSADTTLGTLEYDTTNGQFKLMVNNTASVMTITNAEMKVKENNSMPSVTKGVAKAWLSYDYSGGTPSSMASYNVASLGDDGTGHVQINFTTAMEAVHYSIVGMPSATRATMNGSTLLTGSADFKIWNSSDTLADIDGGIAIFGEAT